MPTDFDYARAIHLMQVMHQVATIAPKATSIFGLAQRELDDLNDEAKQIGIRLNAEEQAAQDARDRERAEKLAAERAEFEQQQRDRVEQAKVDAKARADAADAAAKATADATPPITSADGASPPERRI